MAMKRTASERIEIVKNKKRPNAPMYIEGMCSEFIELRGDRLYGNDYAIYGGIGKLGEHVVTIVAHHKGMNTDENIKSNFAMPHPEGYRKALRLMKQAEKFHRPILCLVDTPGAFCGVEAEERGQSEAIARNLMEMMGLKVPIISVVLGEGGSGGALGLAVANEVYMLENATYSVISPKGFASILWKDASREKEAAELLRMTAYDLLSFGVIEGIIPEPEGGAHNDIPQMTRMLKQTLLSQLDFLCGKSPELLVAERYNKFRRIGVYHEE